MIADTNYCRITHEDRGVADLTICNSESLNINGTPTIAGVTAAISETSGNDSVRALVQA